MGLRQTGVLINGQPQVEMDLLVTVMGPQSVSREGEGVVPLIMLNRLQGTLPVRVDPARPESIVVQWDSRTCRLTGRWPVRASRATMRR